MVMSAGAHLEAESALICDLHSCDTNAMDRELTLCRTPRERVSTQETPTSTATTTLSDDDSPPSRHEDGDEVEEQVRGSEREQEEPESTRFGFVARLLREYSLKREVNLLIAKKQQQLREMQALILRYQSGLQRCIKGYEAERTAAMADAHARSQRSGRSVVDAFLSGRSIALRSTQRCVALLRRRQEHVSTELFALRLQILETRREECDWLFKSITNQLDAECLELSSAMNERKFLEDGSLQAKLSVVIQQEDPFFASPEQLFESQPQIKQLELQLSSLESVLNVMAAKVEALEALEVEPAEPTPLVKRSSFRERKETVESFPQLPRSLRVKRRLHAAMDARDNRSLLAEERHKAYVRCIRDATVLLADIRTRSGRLALKFARQLQDDVVVKVEYRWSDTRPPIPMDQETYWGRYVDPMAARMFVELDESSEPQCNETRTVFSGAAIDRLKLPPPGVVVSFARFLVRLVQSEYGIVTSSDADWDAVVDPTDGTLATSKAVESDADRPIDPAVLHDAVHELLFSRIPRITTAYAVDLADDAANDNQFSSGDSESHQSPSDASPLFPWHWVHSKRSIQGLCPTELAFPPEVAHSITTFTATHDREIRQRGFLPETLEALRAVERAITPAGIVQTVMTAFRVLHRELVRVLATAVSATDADAHDTVPRDGPRQRRPLRRTSCFLNADVLIPSLVLLFSRVPQADDLDALWLRLQSVHAFRRALLSDGCEEAYYVTCLTAAMEFVSAAALSPEASCEQCRLRRAQLATCCRVQSREAAALSTVTSSPPCSRIVWSSSEETSVRRLSQWISEQSPLPDAASDALTEENLACLLAAHELWP